MNDNPYRTPDAVQENTKENSSSGFMKFIKVFFIVIGVIVTLLIGLISLLFITSPSYEDVDEETKVVVETVIPHLTTWDYEEFVPYLHQSFIDSSPVEQQVNVMNSFRKLGEYQSHSEPQRQNCMSGTTGETYSRCNYTINADFANGNADIFLGMVKQGERTLIIQLQVNSDAFME
ncbi:hypothetical protein [Hahella ganghwensis]|uniref:hypothetical protein n=1 Tax=Hahella ganghwensis TaxID=286420 RepID=UPI000362102A|nr:hypothetical protein [Hahella ganghwensis]